MGGDILAAHEETAEPVGQQPKDHETEGGEDYGIKQRVPGGAWNIGTRQYHAVGKAKSFLFFLDQVPIEPGFE